MPAAKRARTDDGSKATPLERRWTAAFKALPPKRQVGVLQRRKELGNAGLLLDADTLPKASVASLSDKIRAWCPESTSLSVARGGSGGLALTMADTFDIVHAFEADKQGSACLKHNVDLMEKDWVLVHGPATEEEGDYLFALEEIESDVLLVSLLCDDHDTKTGAERHEPGSEFCDAVEMLVQAIFGKVQMVVALLPADFPVQKLHDSVAAIPRATKSTAMQPSTFGDLLLQPIKLGAWGSNLESHQLLDTAGGAAAAASSQKGKKQKGGGAGAAAPGPRPLTRFRAFESWVKRCFVSHAAAGAQRPGITDLAWLDMACGRCAEMDYIVESGVTHLVLADADEDLIARAIGRYNKKKMHTRMTLTAAVTDLGTPGLRESVRYEYDVVSCFRGLQHSFSSAEQAKQWIHNAAVSLRKGGVFVGIIPDANVIVKRLQAAVSNTSSSASATASTTVENPAYSIDLSEASAEGGPDASPFGHQYRFRLGGASAKAAGDPGDDEYLLHFPTLQGQFSMEQS